MASESGDSGEALQGPRTVGYLGDCSNPVPFRSPKWSQMERSLGASRGCKCPGCLGKGGLDEPMRGPGKSWWKIGR